MDLKRKEITFRAWFEVKFGVPTLDEEKRVKYFTPKGIAETEKMFRRDFPSYTLSFNSVKKYMSNIQDEVKLTGTYECFEIREDIDLSEIEAYTPDIQARAKDETEHRESVPFEFNVFEMDDMEDIPPKLHRTDELIDLMDSTYAEDELGGQYGGTVTIVTGESGSGKTTLLADKLAKYKRINPNFKPLYISTEMTRGDLRFYKMSLPGIGKVPTILIMDYIRNGHLKKVIDTAFTSGFDMILLDSYQDLLGKLSDTLGWTTSVAQRYIIDLMLDSAEKQGTAVYAIQHLTKGGTYVGSTFLKHTTTAMLELKIDKSGRRYFYYSKNRRGGQMQHKPMYFDICKEKKEVVYDAEKWHQAINAEAIAKEEKDNADESHKNFLDVLEQTRKAAENGESADGEGKGEGEVTTQTPADDGIAHPENEPPLTFSDEDTKSEDKIASVSEAMNDMAEDIDFEEVDA